MNCKHVEELLPLYVGGDLEEELARLVTAHVQTCNGCALSAEEYGEAGQLMQMFEPPPFSDATYRALRSHVLREIQRESTATQGILAFEFLRRAFQPRILWAVSTAVLLAACLFAYYFVANRSGGPQLTGNPGAVSGGVGALAGPMGNNPDSALTGIQVRQPVLATSPPGPRLNQAAWHPRRPSGTPAVPERLAKFSPETKRAASPTSAEAEKPLRLEIQTSDQNIRIIWFSHSSTKEGLPIESSKGI